MLSVTQSYDISNPPPHQPSLPRRTDSLSSSIAKPKLTSPIVQSREDLKFARIVLNTPIISEQSAQDDEETQERRREDRERELTDMLGRMSNWVDELATLLQQAYKNQTDLETALTLTRSNLQLALANNEMLEEAVKRGGGNDIGWRRWSEREGVRRTSSVREYSRPSSVSEVLPPTQPQSGPSRFFNFKSTLQRVSSSSNTSPTSTHSQQSSFHPSETDTHMHTASAPSLLPSANLPSSRSATPGPSQNGATSYHTEPAHPPSPPTPSARELDLAAQLSKERAALQALGKEKSQLENELESLSQALFEEANKMVSVANRKLAETEEELRVATEQKEALRGALRIVEGENGELRGRASATASPAPSRSPSVSESESESGPRITVSTSSTPPASATLTATRETFWSPVSPEASASSPLSATPAQLAAGHRWSVLPRTPRSRSAVRNEFEQAMRRMHDLVGEDVEAGETDAHAVQADNAGAHEHEAEEHPPTPRARDKHPDPAVPPEPVSPRLEFAAPRRSSESEVEEELDDAVGSTEHNPWTS